MKIIRAILVLFFFLLFGAGAGVLSLIIFPLSKFFVKKENLKKHYSRLIFKTWKFAIFLYEKTGILSIEVDKNTREIMKNIRGKVIVASHPSLLDIVILVSLIPNSICVAKTSLSKNILLSGIIRELYIINSVEPEKFKNDAKNALLEGFNLIIFPTGKRTKPNEELKIHKGAALAALHSGCDILPVRIETDKPFLGINQSILDVHDSRVNFKIEIRDEIKIEDYIKLEKTEILKRNDISRKIKEAIAL